ncbi:MAG: 1,4-dihydroxy-6-naphthoate synthase, partial [Flavobacteriales bacterium]|nr:1,4-dihydroxy-6-naphthoate synthase [Flavobacteriales bacterium]
MRVNLAISPCPNDTFIFEGLVNKKIDTEGLDFKITLADIGQLNKWSIE